MNEETPEPLGHLSEDLKLSLYVLFTHYGSRDRQEILGFLFDLYKDDESFKSNLDQLQAREDVTAKDISKSFVRIFFPEMETVEDEIPRTKQKLQPQEQSTTRPTTQYRSASHPRSHKRSRSGSSPDSSRNSGSPLHSSTGSSLSPQRSTSPESSIERSTSPPYLSGVDEKVRMSFTDSDSNNNTQLTDLNFPYPSARPQTPPKIFNKEVSSSPKNVAVNSNDRTRRRRREKIAHPWSSPRNYYSEHPLFNSFDNFQEYPIYQQPQNFDQPQWFINI